MVAPEKGKKAARGKLDPSIEEVQENWQMEMARSIYSCSCCALVLLPTCSSPRLAFAVPCALLFYVRLDGEPRLNANTHALSEVFSEARTILSTQCAAFPGSSERGTSRQTKKEMSVLEAVPSFP